MNISEQRKRSWKGIRCIKEIIQQVMSTNGRRFIINFPQKKPNLTFYPHKNWVSLPQ